MDQEDSDQPAPASLSKHAGRISSRQHVNNTAPAVPPAGPQPAGMQLQHESHPEAYHCLDLLESPLKCNAPAEQLQSLHADYHSLSLSSGPEPWYSPSLEKNKRQHCKDMTLSCSSPTISALLDQQSDSEACLCSSLQLQCSETAQSEDLALSIGLSPHSRDHSAFRDASQCCMQDPLSEHDKPGMLSVRFSSPILPSPLGVNRHHRRHDMPSAADLDTSLITEQSLSPPHIDDSLEDWDADQSPDRELHANTVRSAWPQFQPTASNRHGTHCQLQQHRQHCSTLGLPRRSGNACPETPSGHTLLPATWSAEDAAAAAHKRHKGQRPVPSTSDLPDIDIDDTELLLQQPFPSGMQR